MNTGSGLRASGSGTGDAWGFRSYRAHLAERFPEAGLWPADPALRALIQQALAGNLDIRIAAARIEQARARAGATGLVLLPQVALTADHTRNKQSALAVAAPNVPRDLTTNRVSLTATWEIDLWGRVRSLNEAAYRNFIASEENRRALYTSLIAQVTLTYLDLMSLDAEARKEQVQTLFSWVAVGSLHIDLAFLADPLAITVGRMTVALRRVHACAMTVEAA